MREAAEERRAPRAQAHSLTMERRQRAVITGVEDVDSYNEQMVVLLTSEGMLTLLGEELHIARLNLEEGQLVVEGHLAALEYDDKVKSGRSGLFGRLFK